MLPAIVITEDFGGEINGYFAKAYQYEKEGRKIIVRGECISACTIYLHNPRLCAEPTATFGFHASMHQYMDEAGHWQDAGLSWSATQRLVQMYPRPVNEWINVNGGLGYDTIYLEGPEMRRLIPQCRAKKP